MAYGFNNQNLTMFFKPTNESFSTMGRQMWDDIKHLFNGETWTDEDAAAANYLKAKRKYFDELFTLSSQLKSKLTKWISKIPGVMIMSHSSLSQMLSGTTTEKETMTTHTQHGSYTHTIDVRQRNELALQQKARANNGRNSMTYATCTYILDVGNNKAALLFFTFDSDGIDVCQVLTKNQYSTGGRSAGYDMVKVPEWNSVVRNEYMK